MAITILDGPMGTELNRRGVETTLPLWSARALIEAPEIVAQIHCDYAQAGATVHTANTFRTKRRQAGERWGELTDLAVKLARDNVPDDHRIAGSISPLEDCYRPDLSPPADVARAEHREMAKQLADAGVDIILCETFPHVGEALITCEESVATGVETWVSLSAGPDANLLTPAEIAQGAVQAVELGASAVLVNCIPASQTLNFVKALAEADLGVPIGAYANAGHADERIGWVSDPKSPDNYSDLAHGWIDAGSSILGSCCGTGPDHIKKLATKFASI